MSASTIIICLVLLLIVIYTIKSYTKKLNQGCCGGGDTPTRNPVADKNASHYPYHCVLAIRGMTCDHCAARIENALNALDGTWATVHLKKNEAEVRTKQPLDENLLRRTVAAAGYTVTEVRH